MSDIPDDWRGQLDLRAEIVRIDRERAEAQKFQAEREKLLQEALKYRRERWLAPVLAVATVIGGVLGAASFIAHLIGH